MIVGYARVSTLDQKLDAQHEALTAAGATKIFQEKISGAKADRPALTEAIAYLQKGDILLVTRMDRLARSTTNLLRILDEISKRGAMFKSIHEPMLDTTTPQGHLIITVLGAIAQFERELIKSRTSEGRARAKASGKSIGGPKPRLTPAEKMWIHERLNGGEAAPKLAIEFSMSTRSIERLRQAPV